MKLLKFICGRVFITACLLVLELAWLLVFFMKLTSYSTAVSILFTVLSILMMLFIICKDDNPAYKIGWIVMISAVPLVGGLLYLCFGNKRPSKRLRMEIAKEEEHRKEVLVQNQELFARIEEENPRVAGEIRYIAEEGPYPVQEHTEVTYFPLGEQMFAAMMEEMEKAEHFIFLEYFIIARGTMWDSMLELLTRKAAQGVDVRLIYDDVGSLFLLPANYAAELEKRGIKCFAFNRFVPVLSLAMNNRDHRKILVIDGHTAFNGGINLADEYININSPYGHWKDTGIMLKGEGVWSFTVMFLEMWNAFYKSADDYRKFAVPEEAVRREAAGYVQPFSDSPLDDRPVSENVYIDILFQAEKYVYIYTPYLIISSEMQNALMLAAKRGVDVRIITPGIPDKKMVFMLTRSYYASLIRAGVKIYEYTPGFVHAKCFVCDDAIGIVGTINMDYRSLYLHFECGTFLYQVPALLDLKQDYLETVEKSRRVALTDCRSGFFGSLLTALLRVLSPLF